jgi:hypothetical protein
MAGAVVAGTPSPVTLRVQDTFGNTVTNFNETRTLTWSGAAAGKPAGGGVAPTLPVSVSFASGEANILATLTLVGSGQELTATTTSGVPTLGGSSQVSVSAGAANGLGFVNTAINGVATPTDCLFSASCTSVAGNKGSFTASVVLIDSVGNRVAAPAGGIAVTTTGVNGTVTYSTGNNVNIPSNAQISTATVTLTRGSGNNGDATLTSTATIGGTTKSVTATVKFQ